MPIHYSSFHVLFHDPYYNPNITPGHTLIHYSTCHFLFHYPHLLSHSG